MENPFVTRFAPSPTGLLHLGHAYSALTAYEAARAAGGKFLLRIEDIDATRCKAAFEKAIYEDLAWLGVTWEQPARRQSEHFGEYAAALDKLRAMGLVYRCFKTRKEVLADIGRAPHAPQQSEPVAYVGKPLSASEEEQRLAAGAPYAWRLSAKKALELLGEKAHSLSFTEDGDKTSGEKDEIVCAVSAIGDAVIARKDLATSYHLASVYDDALQGISHVIRGEDLFDSTHLHRLLQALLDLPTPVYRHHRLITDENGKRFAKRDCAATLKSMRDNGVRPAEIRARLGFQPE